MIRPLVEGCNERLENLLRYLGRGKVIRTRLGNPLLTKDMNRILKIARKTDDRDILLGAFEAVSVSKYLKTAGPQLLSRMIKEGIKSGHFISLLTTERHMNREKMSDREREILLNITKKVLETPEDYSFLIRTQSAKYIAEHVQPTLRPLLEVEEEFGIKSV
jgi:hypothetical protein